MFDDEGVLDNRRFLPEIARLLFTWQDHQFEPCSKETLCYWARTTAGRTRLSPQPLQAVIGLDVLSLLDVDQTGECTPSQRLLPALSQPLLDPETFSLDLAICLFEALLTTDPFRSAVERTLHFSWISTDTINLDWSDVSSDEKRNVAWIWLQQLGLASHTGADVALSTRLLPFILDVLPQRFILSQAQLDARLLAQRQRALLAEEYVLQFEKERLRAAGQPEFAVGVIRISDDDVLAGYDILSFDALGNRRFIEVKSSGGPLESFVWSRNEFRCAQECGDSYWLAWVGWASRLPAGPCELAWFQNPAAILGTPGFPWTIEDGDFRVRAVQDQRPFMGSP